ncbi:MAG: hypothetical protein EBT68_05055 [Verrucomicrobia bacterium]|nr:hypothetical protein [Verrucomicrobiota bacterium]
MVLPYTTPPSLFTVKGSIQAVYVRTMNNQALIDAVHELLRLKEVQTEAYTKACDRSGQGGRRQVPRRLRRLPGGVPCEKLPLKRLG